MEHKIGEVFEVNGIKVMAKSSNEDCSGCAFLKDHHCSENDKIESCYSELRKDRTEVIFVEVKDNNTSNNKNMETRNIKISLNTAKEWFKGSDETLKKLALQAYKEEELKDGLPNSWEEFCYRNKCFKDEVYIGAGSDIVNHEILGGRAPKTDRNLLSSYKSAEAHIALMQLEILRDCYRDGFKPDWEDSNIVKYTILNEGNKLIKGKAWICSRFLSFQSEELCDKFFDNFKDLIEIAKDKI